MSNRDPYSDQQLNQRPVLASDIASATIPLVDLSKRVPEVVLRDFSSKSHPGDA